MRDSQRSKVYAWERSIDGLVRGIGTLRFEEAEAMFNRIWRSERGRYGHAKRQTPVVKKGRGGGRTTMGGTSIKLGVWARQPSVVLHEMAHCLAPVGEHHGPRFVGTVIGLYCRHMGMDRDELVERAYERGVKVNLTAIGAVPEFGWHKRVERALWKEGGSAKSDMALAITMGVSFRVVRGAMLTLIRQGRARYAGRKLILTEVANAA